MDQQEADKAVEEALNRWRNPPPSTEEDKRKERAAAELLETLGEDE